MAVLRVQENIQKADGAYDVVHKETEAGLVLFDDNETFQQKYDAGELNGKDGKSPYQQAVEGGYAGTEAEFKAMLASGPWLPTSGGTMSPNAQIQFNDSILTSTPTGTGNVGLVCQAIGGGFNPMWVGTPTTDSHAATKQYVDDAVANAGGCDIVTYGTCSTSASTAAKVVSLSGFTLTTGAVIWVKFTNANTAYTPSLNVNNTGAKNIKKYGSTAADTYLWQSGEVVSFVYDGSYWVMVDGGTATTTYYGMTKLIDSTSSSSTTLAATANSVRQAYSRANEAYSLASQGGSGGGSSVIQGTSVLIGPSASVSNASGANVVIGQGANSMYGVGSIVIGDNTGSASPQSVVIGTYASSSSSASNGVAIGAHAFVGQSDSVALGQNANVTGANTIQLGNPSLSSLSCAVYLSTTSDRRDKTDIIPLEDNALEFIQSIEPVRYKRNPRLSYIDRDSLNDDDRENLEKFGMCEYDRDAHEAGQKAGDRRRVGVIAQQVIDAMQTVFGDDSYINLVDDNLYDYADGDIPDGVESQLSVNYSGFIPVLIKAIQELAVEVDELKKQQK